MKKQNLMMSALLMSFLTMFTTSCVQGDLFDELYEDSDGMYLPRKKKGLDYNGPSAQELNAAQSYVNSGSFSPTENECFACALYNYSVVEQQNKTPYQMREYVGKGKFGNTIYWPIFYRNAILLGGGIEVTSDQESSIISSAVNAQPHSNIPSDRPVIVGINCNHYGLVSRFEFVSDYNKMGIWILDQSGESRYFLDEIDSSYY